MSMPSPRARLLALIPLALASAVLTLACGGKYATNPVGSGQSMVVLLPDADTGTTGHATVSTAAGSVPLAAERDATFVRGNKRPDAVRTISDGDVQAIFGGALMALPAPMRHFTLFFKFDSDELTDESRAQLPDVIRAVNERQAPDVAIVGHTDSAGVPVANVQLGMKRATAVRTLLLAAGLNPALVEVTSHGEADPLIQTPDETAEPRNRRVEISVR